MRRLLFLAGVLVVLVACRNGAPATVAPAPTGDAQMQQFVTRIEQLAQNFSETVAVADDTSVENLPPVIRQLQTIQTEVKNLDAPADALKVQAALDSYMDSKIQCYFKKLKPQNATSEFGDEKKDLCSLSASKFEYFRQQFDALKQASSIGQ